MFWLTALLQWLHVLGGIFWFGSSLMTNFVLVPILAGLAPDSQRAWAAAFAKRYGPIVGPIGGLVILLGIVRGITGGVLGSLGSPYGLTWIAAIVVGVALAGVGGGLIARTVEKLGTASGQLWDESYGRIKTFGRVELGLFAVTFTLMIAMRFGY